MPTEDQTVQESAATESPAGQEAVAETPEQTPAVSAPADEGEQEEKPKPKGGFQRRIDRLTREREDAARQADFWRGKALEAKPAEAPREEPTDDPKPKFSDFGEWETFFDSRDAWSERQAKRIAKAEAGAVREAMIQEEAQRQQEADQRTVAQQWTKREAESSQRFPDFIEKAEDCREALEVVRTEPGVPVLAEAILRSDPTGEFEYYLGSHPEEVERIARLRPVEAGIAIGKVFSTFATQESAGRSAPPVSKAPPPPKPVGKSSPTATGLSDDLSPEEWKKRFFAKLERK
jgi:hypothetical protein